MVSGPLIDPQKCLGQKSVCLLYTRMKDAIFYCGEGIIRPRKRHKEWEYGSLTTEVQFESYPLRGLSFSSKARLHDLSITVRHHKQPSRGRRHQPELVRRDLERLQHRLAYN